MTRYSWKSYEDAKKIVHRLGLTGKKAYSEWSKTKSKPKDIPASPSTVYDRQGTWKGWGDWLGTGVIATFNVKYRSFEDARKFARSSNIETKEQWQKIAKLNEFPKDIPRNPDSTYRRRKDTHGGKWKGWGDWLGTGNVAKKDFCTFQNAKRFVRNLNLQSISEWNIYSKSGKLPRNIPRSPATTYKTQWTTWGDFLGTGNVANQNKKYYSYNEAKKFARKQKIKSMKQWREFVKSGKLPDNLPCRPDNTYKKQGTWKGWGDFLETGRIADMNKSKQWLPIKEAKIEARKIAKELNIKSELGWMKAWKAGKIPKTLPRELSSFYNPKRKRGKK